jgi:tetratricopeptide (TPR) repeat protein
MLPATRRKTKAHDLAFTGELEAYYSALTSGDAIGAAETISESIDTYKSLFGPHPTPENRRELAQAYKNLAEVQQLAGKKEEALAKLRISLKETEKLLEEDPKDKGKQIDFEQGLTEAIALLHANRLFKEERAETKRALEFMKPLADGDNFQHAEDYAQLLATTSFDDLRDDAAALRYARKAVSLTHETDPDTLHVLALAYERNGNRPLALETANKALSKLPADQHSEFRKLLEADITRLLQ